MTARLQGPAVTDEFGDDVKRAIAGRAADRCANPQCRALTGGPTNDRMKSFNVGVAVHIRTVASRGHRYDPALSNEEYRDQSNAIWLCQRCASVIDNDVARYSTDLLRAWKKTAETEVLQSV